MRKNEALIRFLETEDFDAAIIFVRTKNTTLEVSEVLEKCSSYGMIQNWRNSSKQKSTTDWKQGTVG